MNDWKKPSIAVKKYFVINNGELYDFYECIGTLFQLYNRRSWQNKCSFVDIQNGDPPLMTRLCGHVIMISAHDWSIGLHIDSLSHSLHMHEHLSVSLQCTDQLIPYKSKQNRQIVLA